jgi:hypothetical protein
VNCDVVFVQGFGDMTDILSAYGVKEIRFVPAFGDPKRFYPLQTSVDKEFDIVMIGNNIISRNPFRHTMPGIQLRLSVVERFSGKYGERFAVYGNNWKNNSARGPLPYGEQNKIYHKSKIALSVNNASGKYYFSDRLPVAMLSGIPILQCYEEGIEDLLKNCEGVYFFKTVDEALAIAEHILEKSPEELKRLGTSLHTFAMKLFTPTVAFSYMMNVLREKKYHLPVTPNPWLGH